MYDFSIMEPYEVNSFLRELVRDGCIVRQIFQIPDPDGDGCQFAVFSQEGANTKMGRAIRKAK